MQGKVQQFSISAPTASPEKDANKFSPFSSPEKAASAILSPQKGGAISSEMYRALVNSLSQGTGNLDEAACRAMLDKCIRETANKGHPTATNVLRTPPQKSKSQKRLFDNTPETHDEADNMNVSHHSETPPSVIKFTAEDSNGTKGKVLSARGNNRMSTNVTNDPFQTPWGKRKNRGTAMWTSDSVNSSMISSIRGSVAKGSNHLRGPAFGSPGTTIIAIVLPYEKR